MTQQPGRPAYRLTAADFGAAVRYIERARQRGEVGTAHGYASWLKAATPEALQAWCDEYLPADIWRKMMGALRQARKRARDYRKAPVHRVDLSHPAWVALTRTAGEMGGVTLSEAVLRLEEAYSRADGAGTMRSKR
jgi:macrodomain Ter protein organizer (MatP/YcbG family)